MADLPPPPYGPEVRLARYDAMMLPVVATSRQGRAALRRKGDPVAFIAAQNLRLYSWSQTPSGSLPPDEDELMLDGAGVMDERIWKRVRETVLAGWRLHADGRLYHPEMVEIVSEAWRRLSNFRDAGAKGGKAKRAPGKEDKPQMSDSCDAANRQPSDSYDASFRSDHEKSTTYKKHRSSNKNKEEEREEGKTEERGDAVDARENSPPPSEPSPRHFAPTPERYGGGAPPGRPMTPLPAEWRSEGGDPASILDSPALLSAALDAGMTTETARDEAHRFADHHAARDSRFADWPAAWRNWCRRHADFSRNRGGPGSSGGPHADRSGSGGGLVDTILRRRADRLAVGGWEYPAGRA